MLLRIPSIPSIPSLMNMSSPAGEPTNSNVERCCHTMAPATYSHLTWCGVRYLILLAPFLSSVWRIFLLSSCFAWFSPLPPTTTRFFVSVFFFGSVLSFPISSLKYL